MTELKPMTQLEQAQLLQDFIDVRIKVALSKPSQHKMYIEAVELSEKLFNQIAGIE